MVGHDEETPQLGHDEPARGEVFGRAERGMELIGGEALARRRFSSLDGALDVFSGGLDLDADRGRGNRPARRYKEAGYETGSGRQSLKAAHAHTDQAVPDRFSPVNSHRVQLWLC